MKTICLLLAVFVPMVAAAKPGDLIRYTDKAPVTKSEVTQTLNVVCPGTKAKVDSSLRFISFTYETTTADGKATEASAAFVIPILNTDLLPLVSYQHGTTVERRLAPSSGLPQTEGRGVGTCYASQRAAVVIADYLGYGDSNSYHPYLHADTEASAAADAIRAAKTLAERLNLKLRDKLFLAGYSQGGHATMALHRYLESRSDFRISVTAAAPMAGPYDLSGTVVEALKTPDPAASTEAAFVVLAYNNVYSLFANLEAAIQPPYTKGLAEMLPGDKSFSEVMSVLPSNPVDLLEPAFLKDVLTNPQSPFMAALRKNDLLDWKPLAPVMLIHGSVDIEVPKSNTVKAEKAFRAVGADVHTVWIEGKDHGGAAPQAFTESIKWFNGFL